MIAAEDAAAGAESVDPAVIAALRAMTGEDQRSGLVEVVDLYLRNTALRLAELRGAAARGDAPAVAWHAHGLKGSSGLFGARRMARLSVELQAAASQHEGPGCPAEVDEYLDQLDREFTQVRAELERLR